MAVALWTVVIVLAAAGLLVSAYAFAYGIEGAFLKAGYERCPLCHHHYLDTHRADSAHACSGGAVHRLSGTLRQQVHHLHAH